MNGTRPLLIFDSGVGGLSVLREVQKQLPKAPIVYAADNAGYPYGTKTAAVLEARIPALLGRLAERYDPELIVIACNTASTIALDAVRNALDLPVVGTVPAIKPAASLSRSRVIGVLGTPATVIQPYVDRLAAEFAGDCTVLRHGSAELVDLAEAKLAGNEVSVEAVRAATRPMFDAPNGDRIDVGVLACTHFPLLRDELSEAFPGVQWIDGGPGIARRIAWLTREQTWPVERTDGVMVFTAEPRSPLLSTLARYGIGEVRTL